MIPEEFNKNYELALATQVWNYISPMVHENTSVSFTEGTYTILKINWIKKDDNISVYTFNYKGATFRKV